MNERYEASAVSNRDSHGYLGSKLETYVSRLLSVCSNLTIEARLTECYPASPKPFSGYVTMKES